MTTETIKEQLHQFIDSLANKRALAIYALFEEEIDTDARRKSIITSEREKYLLREGKSFSFEQVKAMALNKELRDEL